MYSKCFKRVLDVLFSVLLLGLLSPVILLVALTIKLEDPKGPVFFTQLRVGKNLKPFVVMKFRSMKLERVRDGKELSDEERMLKLGGLIRKLSLDELPQLLNVLKGEMSFIGPRPLPVVYYPYYTDEELHRHDVTPGISGLAQVNGRNLLTWEEKFQYDLTYVRNIGFLMDVKVVLMTMTKVLKGVDVAVRKKGAKDGSLDEIRNPLRKELCE